MKACSREEDPDGRAVYRGGDPAHMVRHAVGCLGAARRRRADGMIRALAGAAIIAVVVAVTFIVGMVRALTTEDWP